MTPAEAPLGTVRQWLVEWTGFGGALGAAGPVLAVTALGVVEDGPPDRVLAVIVSFAVVGALVGASLGVVTAWPAHGLSRWLWTRVHPMSAMLLGPFLGGVGGAVLGALLVAGPLGEPSERALTLAALAGGSCAGLTLAPVWVAYLALHARGRSGWGALGVAGVWTPITVVGTLGSVYLYLR